jgi:hypothetical protein
MAEPEDRHTPARRASPDRDTSSAGSVGPSALGGGHGVPRPAGSESGGHTPALDKAKREGFVVERPNSPAE